MASVLRKYQVMSERQAAVKVLPRSVLHKGIVIALIGPLLWFVGVQGMAAVAARSGNPALTQLFNPSQHPDAGYQLASTLLAARHTELSANLAQQAVLAAPMDVRSVRLLGQAVATRDKGASTKIMRAAEKLSWRDTMTSMWVLHDAALTNDLPRAINQIDALARRQVQPELIQQLFQASLSDERSRRAFTASLASNPPWRSRFFASMRTSLPLEAANRMVAMLDLLDQTKSPPSQLERMTFIDRMIDLGDGIGGRAYWMRTFDITPENGTRTPYDSMFRSVAVRGKNAVVSPFEWKVGVDADPFVTFQRSAGSPILAIDPVAGGRITLLMQALTLTAGIHRIDVDTVGNPIQKPPASWQVICVPSNKLLVRSFVRPGDELSGVSITIPTSGCSVQSLQLVSNDRIGTQPVLIRSVSIH